MPYTTKSIELTNLDAVPPSLMSADKGVGAYKYFSYITPAAGLANGSTIEVVRLQSGQRILGGLLSYSGRASSTINIGDGTTADKYEVGGIDTGSAGATNFARLPAENFGQKLTADTSIVLTLGGAALVENDTLAGYVVIGGGGV